MTAPPDDDVPSYRLYTSEQAAERAGGGLTKATFDRLARSGAVRYTNPGRRILWTDPQIQAAIAYCETAGGEEAKASASAPRESRTPPAQHPRGAPAPFAAKPGSRYAAATR